MAWNWPEEIRNAKVTALTICEPYTVTARWSTFTLVGSQEEFEMTSQEIADRALEQAKMAGRSRRGVAIDPVQEVHDQPYRADRRLRDGEPLRSHRDGFAHGQPGACPRCCSAA